MSTTLDLERGVEAVTYRQDALEAATQAASRVKTAWELERFRSLANPDLRDKEMYPNAEMREAEVSKTPVEMICPVCDGIGKVADAPCLCDGGRFIGTIGELGGLRRTWEHSRDTAKELLRAEVAKLSAIQTELRLIGEVV